MEYLYDLPIIPDPSILLAVLKDPPSIPLLSSGGLAPSPVGVIPPPNSPSPSTLSTRPALSDELIPWVSWVGAWNEKFMSIVSYFIWMHFILLATLFNKKHTITTIKSIRSKLRTSFTWHHYQGNQARVYIMAHLLRCPLLEQKCKAKTLPCTMMFQRNV